MIRDILTGVFIAWLSLTPEGKKVRDMAIEKVKETYLVNGDKMGTTQPKNTGDLSDNERKEKP